MTFSASLKSLLGDLRNPLVVEGIWKFQLLLCPTHTLKKAFTGSPILMNRVDFLHKGHKLLF